MLGLRSKTKRFSSSINVNYLINIQELKPWPPSKSLKNVRSVVLHWENGSRNSGSTHPANPLDDRVEFSESFMLQVAFTKDSTGNYTGTGFERNPLEFNLYEPKKEKSKGHLIGSGSLDLAEHGILKEPFNLTVQIVNKKSRSATIPLLSLRIQPLDPDRSGGNTTRSMIEKESATEYESDSEVDIINFTDDEAESSHSSVANNEV
jgi:N-terminal C2 in EEIG1 and EHBP1 proteins